MKATFVLAYMIFFLSGCLTIAEIKKGEIATADRHMKNVTQLTFDGDNGEAYFSWDSRKLIFQSNREGYGCDKIWTMNIDGSEKKMVSPDATARIPVRSFFRTTRR